MKNLLIQNGLVLIFSEDYVEMSFQKKDILVSEGKIVQVQDKIEADFENCTVLDASGKCVMPGLINTHTIFPCAFSVRLLKVAISMTGSMIKSGH